MSSPDLHKLPRSSSYSSCCPTKDPKEPVLSSYSASKTQTRWKTLRVRSIHSPPRFCEYAKSLCNILPVNARLLSKILRVTLVCSPRFCDYAHSLWKIPRIHSIHSPRFCEYGHSLNKIPQVRFTVAIPRFCEEPDSLWNILWVVIISVFLGTFCKWAKWA